MLANYLAYQINFSEFFLLSFYALNDKGKREYIGDVEHWQMLNRFGTKESKELFIDKYKTYQAFKHFYGRDAIKVDSSKDRAEFDSFISRHSDIIVKPLRSAFGKGAYLLTTDSPEFSSDEAFQTIIDNGECILEERIIQSEETGRFHPNSVNTLRIATFIDKNDNVIPLFSFFRTGRGTSVVDNAGSGGILASVDVNTGIIFTLGTDELGNRFITHPDSGEQIVGYRIPRWDEALELVYQLARVVPEQKYVGWDLALTDGGWIVVEGNAGGQFVHQYAEREGCREKLSIMKN